MKMMARAPTSAVLACLALLGGSARAMDLQEAYQAALLQDATTRAARAAVEAGDERIRQAEAQRYPNVSLSAGYQRNNLDRTQPNILGEDANGMLLGKHRSTGITKPQFTERARYFNEEANLVEALEKANTEQHEILGR